MAWTRRMRFYWVSQLAGWGLFVLGNVISASIQGSDFGTIEILHFKVPSIYLISLFIFIIGIATTHVFRGLAIRWNWSSLNIAQLLPRMLLTSLVMSICFTLFNTLITDLIAGQLPLSSAQTVIFFQNVLNFSVLFLLWEIIYFAVHIFENWKREEIANLELKASKTEIELNSLKAQINPHFMFNCLNSIRALVDEDPEKAKYAITTLSVILRNNLTLGKRQVIPLREELELIEKYLSLEKIRFEERLMVKIDVDPDAMGIEIPPFLLQTIVENGIKHGISKRLQGGQIGLSVKRVVNGVFIIVQNSGEYLPQTSHEGIGLANSRKRLMLLYQDKATLNISSDFDTVRVELFIPA